MKKMIVTGWILTIVPSLLLTISAVMKFAKVQQVVQGFDHLQLPQHLMVAIGALELGCTVIYLIPRTSVLGAILMTGYLGGAILTHLRIGEMFVVQFLLGVVIWAGIFLREPRLWPLIPLRREVSP